MAAIYYVCDVEVRGDLLTCLVVSQNPNIGHPFLDPSPTLAFQFVCEPCLGEPFSPSYWPLAEHGDCLTPEEFEELRRWMADAPLRRVLPAGQWWGDNDFIHAHTPKVIRSVSVVNIRHAHRKVYNYPAPMPESTYLIRVWEPEFLAHLLPGLEWETTAYPREAYPPGNGG